MVMATMRGLAFAMSPIWKKAAGVSTITWNAVAPTAIPRSASSSDTSSSSSPHVVGPGDLRQRRGRRRRVHTLASMSGTASRSGWLTRTSTSAPDSPHALRRRLHPRPRRRLLRERHRVLQVEDDAVRAPLVRPR